MVSSGGPILVAVHRLIDDQVPREHFGEDPLAFQLGARSRLERIDARGVDQVQRHLQDLGDPDRAIGRLAFDLGRARQRMPFGAGDAAIKNVLLQPPHQLAVFGVDGAQRTEFTRAREAVHQHLVVAHDRALVGHEVLEAVDAVLGAQRAHVGVHAVVPPGHRDVEGVVGDRLGRPLAPLVVGVHQALLRIGNDEVDDHRRAARRGRGGPRLEVLRRDGPHEGQLHVRVGIDATRHHQGATGIDDLGAGRSVQIRADGYDGSVFTEHVTGRAVLGGDDGASSDQDRHERDAA